MGHPTTYFFKYAECKIYVGLKMDEAKLRAWDHNNNNNYRQKDVIYRKNKVFSL